MENCNSKIIVALDNMDTFKAIELATELQGKVWGFKLRPTAFNWHGVDTIKHFKQQGYGKVMADPKCFDIEASMVEDVAKLSKSGADLITVHAAAGTRRLLACQKALQGDSRLLAVTVLTDTTPEEVGQVFYDDDRHYVVRKLWRLAAAAGVAGVVCGLPDLSFFDPQPSLTVCPGFRPPGTALNEQQAIGGYAEAYRASLVVIGRPITQAEDPVKAVELINEGLRGQPAPA